MKVSFMVMAGVVLTCVSMASFAEARPVWTKVRTIPIDFNVNLAGWLDPQFGISIGYAGEVHRSTDGGTNWPKASNRSMCRFGLEIVDRNVAYHCGNGSEVGKTTDGGITWVPVATFAGVEPLHARYLSFFAPESGWIASALELGSTDDGAATWKKVPLPEGVGMILAITRISKNQGALFDNSGILWQTSDAGKTWTKNAVVTGEFMSDVDFTPITSLRFTDAKNISLVVYVTGETSTWIVRRSSDAGKMWTDQTFDGDYSSVWLDRTARFLTLTETNKKISLYQLK